MTGSRITFREGRDAQPAALGRIVAHVRAQLGERPAALTAAARPLFTGIGASYAAAAVPVHALRAARIPAQRMRADEAADQPGGVGADLLIGISQSGRSTETLAAFEQVSGPARIAVVNVSDSPLAAAADLTVGLGDEADSFASTVGFTGTIVALDLIAAAAAGHSGAGWSEVGWSEVGWSAVGTLVEAARATAVPVAAVVAGRAAEAYAADFVASGASRAAAEEGALLLREVARLTAAASPTRTYLHGEMESAGRTLHVVFGDGREIELARTLARAGHRSVLVTAEPVEPVGDLHVVALPRSAPGVRAVLETVVAQELAAALAEARDVPVESFVFANDDTKQGGLDPADFTTASAS
ncbi:glucosamine--fructose-6-phosphate aminotransferase [Catenulispora yoronensis]|uniref:Glutamine--fructose-6-phosphate aminotransferase [isomerizing] n=1 Tax=Catenulispora yoronensis TaxID=450799 RepID=A0ABP5FFI6_9ACTN